jgi:hypothetical protein
MNKNSDEYTAEYVKMQTMGLWNWYRNVYCRKIDDNTEYFAWYEIVWLKAKVPLGWFWLFFIGTPGIIYRFITWKPKIN